MSTSILSRALIVFAFFIILPSADASERTLCVEFESPTFLRMGSVELTHADIDAFLQTIPEADRAPFLESPRRIAQMLENMVLVEAFAEFALADGLTDDPVLGAKLYRAGITELSRLYRNRLLAQGELQDYAQLAREIYLAEPDLFRTGSLYEFEHVLVPVPYSGREAEAMRLAADVHDAMHDGAKLDDLAELIPTDDGLGVRLDLFSDVNLADLERPVAAVLSELEESFTGRPVRTGFGWHIVRLLDRSPGQALEWSEDVSIRAQAIARERHQTAIMERRFREILNHPIEFAPEAIAELRARYAPGYAGDGQEESEQVIQFLQES